MYDTKCWALARAFLEDDPNFDAGDVDRLAQEIQTAIEDWLGVEFLMRHPEYAP